MGDWTNIATSYGNGKKWHCPVFPGTPPAVAPPPSAPVLANQSACSSRLLFVTLEKTTSGGVLISWSSLDDQSAKRHLLVGATLDAVWNDFDSSYQDAHGDYLFGISPQLTSPVAFTASRTPLGPQDTAMVAIFTAALPTITTNIQNSVASNSNSAPLPENQGNRAFYRFAADWGLDSDGDGRRDWQEIIFDGNNPFAADSDGNGIADIATSGPSTLPTLNTPVSPRSRPSTGAATSSPPRATVEMLLFSANYFKQFRPNHPNYVATPYAWLYGVESSALAQATSFAAFQAIFRGMPLPDRWAPDTSTAAWNFKSAPSEESGTGNGAYGVWYDDSRRLLRLRLDAPAPAGGYRILRRVAKIVEAFRPVGVSYSGASPAEGTLVGIVSVDFNDVMLEVREGQTIGPAVEFPGHIVGENQKITYLFPTIRLAGYR